MKNPNIVIDPNDTKIQKFEIITLDVWGHGYDECSEYDCPGGDRCDGYTVNNAFRSGRTIEVVARKYTYNPGSSYESSDYHADEEAFIKALIEAGYLNDKAIIKIDGEDDYTLFLEQAGDGYPLLQLERVND